MQAFLKSQIPSKGKLNYNRKRQAEINPQIKVHNLVTGAMIKDSFAYNYKQGRWMINKYFITFLFLNIDL